MEQVIPNESHILDYFNNIDAQFGSEKAVLNEIYQDLASRKVFVGNKDIIASLIERLESESDVIKLDIYRNALEIVVQQTPDDLIN
ncbi:biofilm/acid-resistance regulator YmgB/AriR [Erwiniaceae bacterium L1_54_6]|nr:biofilm/acid-resistance regulator YmgB/AriR [Erwiniaceae bacterium L1_54_6]